MPVPISPLSVPPSLHMLTACAMALFGALWGSFALTAARRYAQGQGFVFGRSRCDVCHKTLRLRDLVPFFGYLALRGRCHFCGAPISLLYPVFELGTGLFFLFAYLSLGLSATLFGIALVFVPLCLLAVHDLERETIPDAVLVPMLSAVFVYKWLAMGTSPLAMLLAGLGAALFFLGLRWYGKRVKSRIVLGLGDVKLGVLLGFFTLENVFLVSALGSSLAGIYALAHVRLEERRLLAGKAEESGEAGSEAGDETTVSPLRARALKEREERLKNEARQIREDLWKNLEIPLAPWLILAMVPFVFY